MEIFLTIFTFILGLIVGYAISLLVKKKEIEDSLKNKLSSLQDEVEREEKKLEELYKEKMVSFKVE